MRREHRKNRTRIGPHLAQPWAAERPVLSVPEIGYVRRSEVKAEGIDLSATLTCPSTMLARRESRNHVDCGLRTFLLIGAAQRLAIDGDHFRRQAG
jgi:hypothetical protein